MKLREYQQKGFEDIIGIWNKETSPIMFVLATGGGKTVTFVHVIKHYLTQNANVMLIAHREELITQSHKTLAKNGIQAGIIKADFPQRFEFNTQVCSIQTLSRRTGYPDPDVIIIDEGHHVTLENEYGKLLNKFPNAKILVVTATPYRMDGKGFLEIVKNKETKLIINRTAKQLIDDGWLVPFRYFIASLPNLDNVRIVRGDYADDDAYEAMKLVPVVQSYLKHAKGLRGICYAVNVKHSKEICVDYKRAGVRAEHLDAQTPKEERERILQSFRDGELDVVVNVGILTEGTDFPDCQFVQLARPTKSLSMCRQMVGRATRPCINTNVLPDSESRRTAIATSEKPYGLILDNAKCWEEHGFPDEEIDWMPYFIGKKQKKVKDLGFIDIYVIEDPETGVIKKTANIKETEGSILIEVTKEIRERVSQKNYITEFNQLYYLSKRLRHVQKKGFFIYYGFKKFFDDGTIVPSVEIFDYIQKRLIDEPKAKAEAEDKKASEDPLKLPSYFLHKERQTYLGV